MATLKSLVDETTNIKNELVECHATLKNNLVEKGIEVSSYDKLSYLVDDVKKLVYVENPKKLPKWYLRTLPINDYWFTPSNMPTSRFSLTASAVGEKIYAIGGAFDGTTRKLNECYDTSTNEWTSMKVMPTGRYRLTSSVVNGKIYVFGGYGGTVRSENECYDPITNTWSTMNDMLTARQHLTSCEVDDRIYVLGGLTDHSESTYTSLNECYIP